MVDDELRKAHPEQFEEIPTQMIKPAPAVPDFVTKTKAYIKEHPEVIREVAGDEIQEIEKWLDTLPMGLGDIGKAKLNEFLGAPGNNPGIEQGGKFNAGHENTGLDMQGQGEPQENNPENFMTTQDVRDMVEFMAELSEQGLALPEIADAVWRDYRIEYHPLKIKRMLKSYYARPEPEAEEGNGNGSQNLKIYQKLLEKNTELQRKVAELTVKSSPEVVKADRKGVIRRFLGWLW